MTWLIILDVPLGQDPFLSRRMGIPHQISHIAYRQISTSFSFSFSLPSSLSLHFYSSLRFLSQLFSSVPNYPTQHLQLLLQSIPKSLIPYSYTETCITLFPPPIPSSHTHPSIFSSLLHPHPHIIPPYHTYRYFRANSNFQSPFLC